MVFRPTLCRPCGRQHRESGADLWRAFTTNTALHAHRCEAALLLDLVQEAGLLLQHCHELVLLAARDRRHLVLPQYGSGLWTEVTLAGRSRQLATVELLHVRKTFVGCSACYDI